MHAKFNCEKFRGHLDNVYKNKNGPALDWYRNKNVHEVACTHRNKNVHELDWMNV